MQQSVALRTEVLRVEGDGVDSWEHMAVRTAPLNVSTHRFGNEVCRPRCLQWEPNRGSFPTASEKSL